MEVATANGAKPPWLISNVRQKKMIWESHYWKEDLLRYAQALQEKTNQKVWRESSGVVVEKTVFLGFYSMRKLLEAKSSPRLSNR